MSALLARARGFAGDRLLRRVVRNSSYLFASNAIGAVLTIATAGLLGVKDFGVLGIITNFVSNVNRLLSFRMGDVVVRYMGEALAQDAENGKVKAAAVVKAAGLLEAATSLLAFGVLALLAPLGAAYNAKDAALVPLFMLFGLSILANITTETATGVLQVSGHFRSQALINLAQSILVAGGVVYAALSGGGLVEVLWAYLAGKIILGLGPILAALYWLPKTLGKDWWRAPFTLLPPWKEFIWFGIHTNFSATINVFARDSEVQWVGFFFGPEVSGFYKVALALINLVVMPINPFISTTYPEITKAFASQQWQRLRDLLRRVTIISASWTALVALGLLLFGQQLLFNNWTLLGRTFHIYRPEYLPAYPLLLILLIGYGTANILFWNRPLLLAQGLAGYALRVSLISMLIKVALVVVLLPRAGYLAEAAILSAYFIISVGWMTWRGLRGVRQAEVRHA
jgi:O-antigen/teichoic acid export membrane protein